VGGYTCAAQQQVGPIMAMTVLGALVFTVTFLVALKLPDRQTP